jgi:hypothetical protein
MFRKLITVIGVSAYDTFFFVLSCYGLATVSVHEEYAAVIAALWVGVLYKTIRELSLRSTMYDAVERIEK